MSPRRSSSLVDPIVHVARVKIMLLLLLLLLFGMCIAIHACWCILPLFTTHTSHAERVVSPRTRIIVSAVSLRHTACAHGL